LRVSAPAAALGPIFVVALGLGSRRPSTRAGICFSIWVNQIDMEKHMRPVRLDRLPEALREELKQARLKRGWSQLELGRRVGLPQVHISAIETGKTVPRFDTLLDLVRVLDRDLVLVPRALVPAVQALIRDYRREAGGAPDEERPLYAGDVAEERDERDET